MGAHEFDVHMKEIVVVNGSGEHCKAESIVSLNNGDSHFIIDDHCYVLVTRRFYDSSEPTYSICAWLSNEAVEVLKTLSVPNCMGSHIVGSPRKL